MWKNGTLWYLPQWVFLPLSQIHNWQRRRRRRSTRYHRSQRLTDGVVPTVVGRGSEREGKWGDVVMATVAKNEIKEARGKKSQPVSKLALAEI